MREFEVSALGTDDVTYVYRVSGPSEMGALLEAYRVHGESVRKGELPLLTPWNTVEELHS